MAREMIRQGGRSARIQAEVHQSVNDLLKTHERSEINFPMVAERAGVTPSTLYRRWGDITQLLADVAVARMHPVSEPEDTGNLVSDLQTFILQYAEEMSSKPGREMLTDVIGSHGSAATVKCCGFTMMHLDTLNQRAARRGEAGFDAEEAVDFLIAPLVYHILFADRDVSQAWCLERVTQFFNNSKQRR